MNFGIGLSLIDWERLIWIPLSEIDLSSNNGCGPAIKQCSNSAIHKAAGLTVPGHSMTLPGTIPQIS